MIIVSQDRDTAINFDNVEIIGIGDPLEDDDGKFKILCNTTSDNQYTIAKYKSEQRANEVLKQVIGKYAQFFENRNRDIIMPPKVYEMPKE